MGSRRGRTQRAAAEYVPAITAAEATALGYTEVRELETGEVAGLQAMMFTVGLFVGIGETGYRTRFCFPTYGDAQAALTAWDGRGSPSGPWIAEKGAHVGSRPNPAFKGVPIVESTPGPEADLRPPGGRSTGRR